MVTRQSHLFIPTLRDDPADADAVSHKLLVRGGYIRQVSAGLWTFMPIGWRVQRKIEQRLDGVLALGRQPHARPCSMSRARSFAKYVMMMSAPARRIPVSASTIARSSSSQPRWPAARIIAYSPDTE